MTDEEFVDKLYLHFLERSPETGGIQYWLDILADGRTRSDVVEAFMSSPELAALQKQKEYVRVQASSPPARAVQEQHILSILQAHVARLTIAGPEEGRSADLPEGVADIDTSKMSRLMADMWASKEAVGKLNPRRAGFLNEVAQAAKKVLRRSLTWYTRSLEGFHYRVARLLEEQANAIRKLENEILTLRSQMVDQSFENEALQESRRTTELAIQEQLTPYVEFFRGVSPVVDIGCGRGEFLVLLKQYGISAYGVDSDPAACEAARRKLLEVCDEDLFEHLRLLPDRSLGGVFSARVIEFLPLHLQMEFISLCSRKIKPGGLILIETTNPESRRGFGRVSYIDPTHLHPVPPELLKSALESNSFRDVWISVLAPLNRSAVAGSLLRDFVNNPEDRAAVLPGTGGRVVANPAYAAVGWRN